MTPDERIVAIATKTGMSQDELRDFLSCTPDQQELLVKTADNMRWTQSKSTLAEVIVILEPLVTIAGVVSGVAGAAGAVITLKALL